MACLTASPLANDRRMCFGDMACLSHRDAFGNKRRPYLATRATAGLVMMDGNWWRDVLILWTLPPPRSHSNVIRAPPCDSWCAPPSPPTGRKQDVHSGFDGNAVLLDKYAAPFPGEAHLALSFCLSLPAFSRFLCFSGAFIIFSTIQAKRRRGGGCSDMVGPFLLTNSSSQRSLEHLDNCGFSIRTSDRARTRTSSQIQRSRIIASSACSLLALATWKSSVDELGVGGGASSSLGTASSSKESDGPDRWPSVGRPHSPDRVYHQSGWRSPPARFARKVMALTPPPESMMLCLSCDGVCKRWKTIVSTAGH